MHCPKSLICISQTVYSFFFGKGYAPDKVSDGNNDKIRRLVDSPIAQ